MLLAKVVANLKPEAGGRCGTWGVTISSWGQSGAPRGSACRSILSSRQDEVVLEML